MTGLFEAHPACLDLSAIMAAQATVVTMAVNWYTYGQEYDRERLAAAVARLLHVTGIDVKP